MTIRNGKGNKDRVVPIGERATTWIEKYISELRPKLVEARHNRYHDHDDNNDEGDTNTIFLTGFGRVFTLCSLVTW